MGTRKLAAVLAAVLLCAPAGCGRDAGRTVAMSMDGRGVELDVDGAARAIVEQVRFTNELVKAGENAAGNYYMLDGDIVAAYAIYIDMSGGSAEEVAVLEAASDADVEALRDIVLTRVDNLKASFESYRPEQMPKLNDPVIETRGRYVILVLADDARGAEDAVAGLFG